MKLLDDFRAKQRLYSMHGAPCSLLKAVLTDGSLANTLYRAMRQAQDWRLVPLAVALQWANKLLNQCLIGRHAEFGPGFVLIHPVGVVINSAVRGGDNVWLESGVVIGDNRGRSPTIGSDVFVGSGAKIIGGLRVGDRVSVGANAVVTRDVPDDSIAVGIPAQCRPRRGG
jgi:serine O-acetyltransferase